MFIFIGLVVLGIAGMAVGFLAGVAIFWTVGLLLIPIGVIGAIVSGIVMLASPAAPRQIQSAPPPGWQAGMAPGWYPDQQNPAMVRYFDGRVWTSSTQPRQ
jgi:hypothetical protein